MKKFTEWFRKQPLQTKTSLVVAVVIGVAALLLLISNLTSGLVNKEENNNNLSPVNTSTAVPTPTSSKTPTVDPINETGPAEDFIFPYGQEAMDNLYNNTKQALIAECKIVEGQTISQKAETLVPYFIDPQGVAEVDDLLYGETKISQECRDVLPAPIGDVDEVNKTIVMKLSYTTFYVDSSQKDLPVSERRNIRKFENRTYTMQLQSDNSWKVLNLG